MRRMIYIAVLISFLMGCESQNPENFPESANEKVSREIYNTYFPEQKNYTFITSGNTRYLKPACPIIPERDKYINIRYEFVENFDPHEIALLSVFMCKKECVKNSCVWKPVIDEYFLPSPYSNSVKIKNYLPEGDYRLWYGFYLKKDSLDKYPRFYKNTCYFSVAKDSNW